jgi:hypothetical protein
MRLACSFLSNATQSLVVFLGKHFVLTMVDYQPKGKAMTGKFTVL